MSAEDASSLTELDKLLREAQSAAQPIPLLKQARELANASLAEQFRSGAETGPLLRQRSDFVDRLLRSAWQRFELDKLSLSLVAVGGYGRGELHPASDIDLLILREAEIDEAAPRIEQFLTLLWDIKLNVGHSVRSVADCVEEARKDIGVATTLMESRVITGSETLLKKMREATGPGAMWPSHEFFRAKWQEQRARHAKFADTEYNLEPNVKSSPGGLRDLQTIAWIALRHYGVGDPGDLARLGFLTNEELRILLTGRDFLWQVRFALHMITGREENRLLFDYQSELARLFGYQDSETRPAVEKFMQQYYRVVLAVGQLNEVIMQHFDQVILRAGQDDEITEINSRFQVRNGYIEATASTAFSKTPSALLEIFVLCAQIPEIEGVHVSTIRLIREHRHLIDEEFRASPRNRRLFMELLRSPHKLARQLRRMNRYGILGKYLPEFGQIVGQMQHDLFHIYTVDAHTLEVVKNMRRFLYPEFSEKFPVTSRVVARLPKLELLYIAGIYHDIGKGRGGDHSELGAVDARTFCENHGLNKVDTNLVCWLVENHLVMSGVAQRKDITDPEVIQEFAELVSDQLHLDYLLALTVADINATNPTLWNAWRGSLLRQLYTETKRALRRGLENQVDKQDWIEQTQRQALEQLEDRGFTPEEVEELWAESGEDYFLREKPGDIVWHTEAMAQHFDKDSPLVLIRPSSLVEVENATQIFIHARNRDYLFSVVAAALEHLDLSVQDARIYSAADGMSMDTFYVLGADGDSISQDRDRCEHIARYLRQQLSESENDPGIVKRRTPRQFRFFSVPTETRMTIDPVKQVTVLEVATPDRPGLLARIGRIFLQFGVELQAAKIATLGERVEDVFFITDANQQPLEDEQLCAEIQAAIRKELDEQAAA
jgi:[protein-PII] uridylyltransferase